MTLIPQRTIKSWVSRHGIPTEAERALMQRTEDNGLFYAYGSSLERLAEEISFSRVVYLDIGFGDGQSLRQLSEFNSEALIVGVEPHLPGVINMLRIVEQNSERRVRIACCDVYDLLSLLETPCFDRIHLYFSDPWPKTRHHKRRLIQQNFWNTITPLIKPDGLIHIATDWAHYAQMIATQLQDNSTWCYHNTDPLPLEQRFVRQPTKYEKKALNEGRFIYEFFVQKA
jgi:tRNA (guanine-N7-)-methyltransferase